MNDSCLKWIYDSIDKELDLYELAGLELPVSHVKHILADKSFSQSYEIDALANAEIKGTIIQEHYGVGQSSIAKAKDKADSQAIMWYRDSRPDPVLGEYANERILEELQLQEYNNTCGECSMDIDKCLCQ